MNEFYIRYKEYEIWSVYQDNAIGPVLQFEGTYAQCENYIRRKNGKILNK